MIFKLLGGFASWIFHSKVGNTFLPHIDKSIPLVVIKEGRKVGWANSFIVCPPFAGENGGQLSAATLPG
ncbi:hypothetical protein [Candidatus Methylobacter favarea]|uniref:hypothetical protein n=1 Tax=Candidatus Methylobacter favarea TaxID=2707345 RepID=UPI00157C9E29|nr:hypothetical protein [Candidatus Methylobacter favarea]